MNSINKRIDYLDYLRGFALLGIMLVNILALLSVKRPAHHSLDASYQRFLYLFVEGRFYTIFSFLFGVGFSLFITRANQKGKHGVILYLRRIIALFLFGFVHFLFQPGEALTVYACCGLVILPFYQVKKEINLGIGLIGLLVFGLFAVKVFMTFPLMLLGLAAGQYRVFERIEEKGKKVALFTFIMLLASVVGLFLQYQHVPIAPFQIYDPIRFIQIGLMIGPIVSACYAGLLLLLLRFAFIQKLLSPLKSYGRMALTNYITQTAFILIGGNVFHLFERITYIESLFFCLAVYIIQLVISVIWLRFFTFGPLEWVWRMVTYMEVPLIR